MTDVSVVTLKDRQLFIQLCDPAAPLHGGNRLYVPLDEGVPVRGSDGQSCIDELEQTILFNDPKARTCQLFTGFAGTGKTTELNRLKLRLDGDRVTSTLTVMVDFGDYIDHYTPISITDVLRVLAYALDREATQQEALKNGMANAPEPGYLRRLFDFLTRTDVELQKIGFSQYGGSLMLEFKNNPTFHQKAEASLALRFQQFAQDATDVMSAAVVRLREATGCQRIVVIADGLEKLVPLREDDRMKMEASVETLFVQNASWLHLPCHAIYTFPLWLRFRASPLGALYDAEPRILPMVKVTEPDGTFFSPGFEKFTDLVGRRVDLRRVFGQALELTLFPLIAASGGYPRDLLRMVREVLFRAKAFPITPAEVHRIIERVGEAYALTVRSTDLDILVEVARTHALPRGANAELAAFGRLLEQWLILAYRNGREWYDLHPLVRSTPIVQEHLAATPP